MQDSLGGRAGGVTSRAGDGPASFMIMSWSVPTISFLAASFITLLLLLLLLYYLIIIRHDDHYHYHY